MICHFLNITLQILHPFVVGCCKTTLIRIAAKECGASFYCLTPQDLYSSFLGSGESYLRSVFRQARARTPAIILLDELDSIISKRESQSTSSSKSSNSESRLLATLLAETDGLSSLTGDKIISQNNLHILKQETFISKIFASEACEGIMKGLCTCQNLLVCAFDVSCHKFGQSSSY